MAFYNTNIFTQVHKVLVAWYSTISLYLTKFQLLGIVQSRYTWPGSSGWCLTAEGRSWCRQSSSAARTRSTPSYTHPSVRGTCWVWPSTLRPTLSWRASSRAPRTRNRYNLCYSNTLCNKNCMWGKLMAVVHCVTLSRSAMHSKPHVSNWFTRRIRWCCLHCTCILGTVYYIKRY